MTSKLCHINSSCYTVVVIGVDEHNAAEPTWENKPTAGRQCILNDLGKFQSKFYDRTEWTATVRATSRDKNMTYDRRTKEFVNLIYTRSLH